MFYLTTVRKILFLSCISIIMHTAQLFYVHKPYGTPYVIVDDGHDDQIAQNTHLTNYNQFICDQHAQLTGIHYDYITHNYLTKQHPVKVGQHQPPQHNPSHWPSANIPAELSTPTTQPNVPITPEMQKKILKLHRTRNNELRFQGVE